MLYLKIMNEIYRECLGAGGFYPCWGRSQASLQGHTDDHNTTRRNSLFEQFCRHKALEAAILASADKLENKEYGTVEGIIKQATEIGLAKDFGTNYWDDPAGRIQSIKDNRGQNTTGWLTFDKVLYGGFNPGELNIFAGGSGSGKSLFMQNMALNWALMGKNVVYITLELSEELCCMRLDAMLTGMGTRDVMKNSSDVELRVKMASKKAGRLQVIQMKELDELASLFLFAVLDLVFQTQEYLHKRLLLKKLMQNLHLNMLPQLFQW